MIPLYSNNNQYQLHKRDACYIEPVLASDCFFLPRRFPKNPPSPPTLLLGAAGRVVIRTVISKLLTSLIPTLRTRNAVLRFAARNAAPKDQEGIKKKHLKK